jgi:hypothetical protein
MSIFGPPNIEKLEKKGDILGLIKALGYTKDASTRLAAAKVLSEWVKYDNKEAIRAMKASHQVAVEPFVAALTESQSQLDRDGIAAALEVLGWTPDKSEAGFLYWVGKRNWAKAGAYGTSKFAGLLKEVGFNIPERADITKQLGKLGDPGAVETLLAVLNKDREDDRVRRAAAQALVKIGVEEVKDNDLVKLALFEEVSTSDPDQAVQLLFDQALQSAPVLSGEMINSQYADVKPRWGSRKLVEGSEQKIRKLVLKNLEHIKKNTPTFTTFHVTAVLYARAVQVDAHHWDSFTPIRVWRKDDSYCVCGITKFITS